MSSRSTTRHWLLALALLVGPVMVGSVALADTEDASVIVADVNSEDCVILVHGLARSSGSMARLAGHLNAAGFTTVNVDYPSRHHTIETLADKVFFSALEACRHHATENVHVVTHSLGGILLREFMADHTIAELQRVVMLAPPNQGSEVVDALADTPGFAWLNGPAGLQLGTDPHSRPRQLGGVPARLGIITGSRSINLVLSQWLPNPDDGKVSVASARLDGMCGFLVTPVSHPFVMKDANVLLEVENWLTHGQFMSPEAEHPACLY